MSDKLCDKGREENPCRLSFHDLCYKQHLGRNRSNQEMHLQALRCLWSLSCARKWLATVQSATPTRIWNVPASSIFTALVVTMLSWYPWYILEYSHGTVRLQQYFLNSLIRALQSRRRPLDKLFKIFY